MTALLRVDASIRTDGSSSRGLADTVQAAALAAAPDLAVVRRELGLDPVPSTTWALSGGAAAVPEGTWRAEQREARAVATGLADELVAADGLLVTAPLYNWGVSQHLKAWVDVVMTDGRFGPRGSAIAGRPAVLVVARGGDYRAGAEREAWDHATGWARRVLGDVWGLDVRLVDVHMTLAPHRPYLAHLVGEAAADLERADAEAGAAGRDLAERLRRPAA